MKQLILHQAQLTTKTVIVKQQLVPLTAVFYIKINWKNMKNIKLFLLLTFLLTACSIDESTVTSRYRLELIQGYDIDVPEPSGLCFNYDKSALYTVNDPPNNKIYKINLAGETIKELSYIGTDLEGITFDIRDTTLWIVEESLFQLVHIDTNGNLIDSIQIQFSANGNSGFEGVTLNSTNNNFYILNEKDPGLLLEIDTNFNIINRISLNFADDYSGIFFDNNSDNYYIVSDESQTLYIWNKTVGVISELSIDEKKIEGVAFNSETHYIYFVSDSEEKLYIYELVDMEN